MASRIAAGNFAIPDGSGASASPSIRLKHFLPLEARKDTLC
jgi:hypothetical protein